MPAVEYIQQNHKDFLKFLKVRYPLYHLSNVFFRDLHYGVMHYLELNKKSSDYMSSEEVARDVARFLEKQGIFGKIDDNTWLLQYPEFKLVSKKPVAAAKPAPAKPAAPAAPRPVAQPSVAPAAPAVSASPAPTPPSAGEAPNAS